MKLIVTVIFIFIGILGMNIESKAAVVEGFTVEIILIDAYGNHVKNELVTFVTQKIQGEMIGTALVMTDENGIARGYFPVSLIPCTITCYAYVEVGGETYMGFTAMSFKNITKVPKLIRRTITLEIVVKNATLTAAKIRSMGVAVLENKRKMEFT